MNYIGLGLIGFGLIMSIYKRKNLKVNTIFIIVATVAVVVALFELNDIFISDKIKNINFKFMRFRIY